jgi:branched-chain amino acid transport system ATP-binding protein
VNAPILAFEKISKRFGAIVIAQEIDLALGEGEALGIIGPNGAGKSTLFAIAGGTVRPDAGRVIFEGADITRLAPERRCRLGIGRAFQIPQPFNGMTVFENVFVAATNGSRLHREAANKRAIEAIRLCGMLRVANRRAETLGLLDRKRLELARALGANPSVLLLDEIGGGLTDAESAALVETVSGLRDRGLAVLWIEHIVHVLLQVVGRLVCMDGGRIIAEGKPESVVAQAAVIDAYLGSRGGRA